MSTATPPPIPPTEEKSQATLSLILSIVGLLCCGPLSIAAWVIAAGERKAIAEGRRPKNGESIATIALVLAIIGTIFLAFGLVWIFFMGGLAAILAAAGAASSR